MNSDNLVIFTQPGCMLKRETKELLSKSHIPYRECDISKDGTALGKLRALNVMSTPVMLYHGKVIVGLDMEKLKRIVGEQKGR